MSYVIPVITIDGPSGSGKGTIGQLLAQTLGWHFLDSGVLYRVLALAAEKHGIAENDETALATLATHLNVRFVTKQDGVSSSIFLEDEEVSLVIRTERCGNMASKVAALIMVRHALLERQRAFRQPPGLVTDGRDMGNVVFPDAQLKFFLHANLNERASRRYQQLKQQGINVSLGDVNDELIERDKRDRTRTVAPLKPAPDAIIIDTTGLSINEVFQRVKEEIKRLPDIVYTQSALFLD